MAVVQEVNYGSVKEGTQWLPFALCSARLLREFMEKPLPSAQLLMAANGRCGCSLLDCPTPKWAGSIQEKMRAGDW